MMGSSSPCADTVIETEDHSYYYYYYYYYYLLLHRASATSAMTKEQAKAADAKATDEKQNAGDAMRPSQLRTNTRQQLRPLATEDQHKAA